MMCTTPINNSSNNNDNTGNNNDNLSLQYLVCLVCKGCAEESYASLRMSHTLLYIQFIFLLF